MVLVFTETICSVFGKVSGCSSGQQKTSDGPSIYVDCDVIVNSMSKSGRCSACTKHRRSLNTVASWLSSDDKTHPSSHTTYATLSEPGKEERLHRLHNENTRLKSQIAHLKDKIATVVERDGIIVEPDLNEDLKNMVATSRNEVHKLYPEESFDRLFWKNSRRQCP